MPTVTMPQLGEGVEEGTIGKWLKKEGDHVASGEPIVEIITDKVNAEVPSPFEGTLTRILVAEGEIVHNDAGLAEVEASEGAHTTAPASEEAAGVTDPAADPEPAAAAERAAPPVSAAPPGGNGSWSAPESVTAPSGQETSAATRSRSAAPFGGRLTPAVRRLARDHAVDLSAVPGTGLGGRITREDVERAIAIGAAGSTATGVAAPSPPAAAPAAPAVSAVAQGDSLKKVTPMRRAIAAQMSRSLEVPTAYVTIEVDMTSVVRRRELLRGEYRAREGVSLSYVAFVTKACVEALRKHADFNAHWTDEGHWRRKAINVGIAVAVEDGLVVPVIKDSDGLSLHGLNMAINDLASRARNRKLKPEEMQGGTFTVDNTGWTGSILTLPIINVPEVAILTMEKVVKRPVVLEQSEGDVIAVRSMMNMCIAIDHRATDGAQAGAFLADVRTWLESVDDRTPVW